MADVDRCAVCGQPIPKAGKFAGYVRLSPERERRTSWRFTQPQELSSVIVTAGTATPKRIAWNVL